MTTGTQIITSLKLMNNSPRMVEDIIDLIVAESIATLVETQDDYSHLHDLFIRSGQDIVENYTSSKYGIDLSTEYQSLHPLVEQVIDIIGSNLFCDMWDADESSTLSEVLRCFGHGTSFWDNHKYQDFGFNEMPKLKTTLESPYDIASTILDKIAEQHPELMIETEEENSDFDIWLAENYSPAGEDASNGEQWYLSVSPNEFMPVSLSTLKEQWEKDNKFIPDADRFDYLVDEEEVEPDNVTTFKIPSHYLSLIFNGDASGYEDADIKAWEQFEQQMIADGFINGHWSYPDNQESYFSYSNDVHNLGDNVVDLQWVGMS